MDITLEHARVLDGLWRLGTIQKTATELNKTHSAIVYSMNNLELQTGVKLFRRTGRRNQFTPEAMVVLKYCKKLLETKLDLESACQKMVSGWEPTLKLIYDEVVDFNFIGSALPRWQALGPSTELRILSAHLYEVEQLFQTEEADIMVTILPLQKLNIPWNRLPPIEMLLVAHSDHPLAMQAFKKKKISDLNRHTFITIKTAQGQVGLSTEQMTFDSYFWVNGFVVKKQAIAQKLGFGWLPDYLIREELNKGSLKVIKSEINSRHTLYPRLYHRPEDTVGKAKKELMQLLRSQV